MEIERKLKELRGFTFTKMEPLNVFSPCLDGIFLTRVNRIECKVQFYPSLTSRFSKDGVIVISNKEECEKIAEKLRRAIARLKAAKFLLEKMGSPAIKIFESPELSLILHPYKEDPEFFIHVEPGQHLEGLLDSQEDNTIAKIAHAVSIGIDSSLGASTAEEFVKTLPPFHTRPRGSRLVYLKISGEPRESTFDSLFESEKAALRETHPPIPFVEHEEDSEWETDVEESGTEDAQMQEDEVNSRRRDLVQEYISSMMDTYISTPPRIPTMTETLPLPADQPLFHIDSKECMICRTEWRNTAIVPCGHIPYCPPCSIKSTTDISDKCPVCRGPIKDLLRLFS
jgi:hypothetical protein